MKIQTLTFFCQRLFTKESLVKSKEPVKNRSRHLIFSCHNKSILLDQIDSLTSRSENLQDAAHCINAVKSLINFHSIKLWSNALFFLFSRFGSFPLRTIQPPKNKTNNAHTLKRSAKNFFQSGGLDVEFTLWSSQHVSFENLTFCSKGRLLQAMH